MCCGTEAGSYLRLIDSCKAQGPFRTWNESKEEEEKVYEDYPERAARHTNARSSSTATCIPVVYNQVFFGIRILGIVVYYQVFFGIHSLN